MQKRLGVIWMNLITHTEKALRSYSATNIQKQNNNEKQKPEQSTKSKFLISVTIIMRNKITSISGVSYNQVFPLYGDVYKAGFLHELGNYIAS